MNVAQYFKNDTVNGEGIRVSLFVSGCTVGCKGCFSPQSHDFNYGVIYDCEFKEMIFNDLSKSYIKGLSILGGHMFEKQNFNECLDLIKTVKELLPNKDIYVWTGLVLNKIKADPIYSEALDYIDVLVDGPFVESLYKKMPLRGSTNQNVLYKNIDF